MYIYIYIYIYTQSDRRESDGFQKKNTRYIFNLKWMYFYKIKGQDMPFELGIQV